MIRQRQKLGSWAGSWAGAVSGCIMNALLRCACGLPSGTYSAPYCCAECANNAHSRGYGTDCTGNRTWHVQRERINAVGEIEYYDTYRTHDGWETASAHFDATAPLPGERVYIGYSDREQARILHWKGELAIPPCEAQSMNVPNITPNDIPHGGGRIELPNGWHGYGDGGT